MTAAALVVETARRGGLHHSLILHGPSPAVLLETSIAIAKALVCLRESTGDDCAACLKVVRGNHPDVHLVRVPEDRKLISAEQVREVVSEASLRPYEGRWKVFIIEKADATSVTAANALLKTLEEPSGNTVFMLLTRTPDLLLPTIRSRSQSIYIGPVAQRQEKGLQPLQLARLERAEQLQGLERGATTGLVEEILDALDRWASSDDTAALLSIAPIVASYEDDATSLAVFAGVLRDLAALPEEDQIDAARARRIRARASQERLLAGAAMAVRSLSRLVVNADLRMLAEQSLVELATDSRN